MRSGNKPAACQCLGTTLLKHAAGQGKPVADFVLLAAVDAARSGRRNLPSFSDCTMVRSECRCVATGAASDASGDSKAISLWQPRLVVRKVSALLATSGRARIRAADPVAVNPFRCRQKVTFTPLIKFERADGDMHIDPGREKRAFGMARRACWLYRLTVM